MCRLARAVFEEFTDPKPAIDLLPLWSCESEKMSEVMIFGH